MGELRLIQEDFLGNTGPERLGERSPVPNQHAESHGAPGPPPGQQVESNTPRGAQELQCHLHVPVPAVHGTRVAFQVPGEPSEGQTGGKEQSWALH